MQPRFATAVLAAMALIGSSCSGGGDEATTPITAPPAAQLPDAAADAVMDMIFDEVFSDQAATTVITTPEDRVAAEAFVDQLTRSFLLAAAARDWDALYEAASAEFQATCPPGRYAKLTASSPGPVEISFGTTDVQVIGDFATGSFEVIDDAGTLRVEGLVAVWEADGWRVAIDPCGVAERAASGEYNYPILLTTTTTT